VKIVWRITGLGLIAAGISLLAGGDPWWTGWGSIALLLGTALFLATWLVGGFLAILASLVLLVMGIIRVFFPGGGWWHWVLLALATFVLGAISITTLSDDVEQVDVAAPDTEPESSSSPDNQNQPRPLPAPSRIRTQLNPSRVISGVSPIRSKKPQVTYDRDCSKCGRTSRPGRRFCGSCGEPLEITGS